ncbi:MAG: ABC transporter ATP-binding protein [Candidatus Heimdallarchaeota archaeon]|nr:ABC transporter ATP-binding protein [Candidatus Heimdallarchaeota archaeon]
MREIFELLGPYVKRHKLIFLSLNVTTIFAATSQILIPVTVNYTIDRIDRFQNRSVIIQGFFIIVLLTFMDLIFQMGQRFSANRLAQNVIFDIRQDLFQTLQHQELEYYASESVGQIMSRTIEEVFSLRDILTWGYRLTALIFWLFVGSFIVMVQVSLEMALIFLILPIFLVVITKRSSARNVKLFYDARFKYGAMNETLAENLTGIQTVKSFGREDEQTAAFNIKNQEFYESSLKTVGVRASLTSGMIFLISFGIIALVLIGGVYVEQGRISPGNFIAFMLLVLQISIPGRFVGFLGIIIQNTQSAALRLSEIFEAPVVLEEKPDAESLDDVKGDLGFENVSFDYPKKPGALENINLIIPAGQKVALLGPTGSGKSSLINLIARFFDPTTGKVTIDGKDISQFTLKSLRKHIGIVHQESFLFTLPIFDNIAFGKENVTIDEVEAAAKAAQIHDFIMTLEDGYETIVGERGVTLSGGERQRVTIARTLLHNPKILIFDDSVSAVDPETEGRIQNALATASETRTTIIISQRPSSLRYVDRIIVLDLGVITQDGTHAELRNVDGIYKNFMDAIEGQIKFLDWDFDESQVKIKEMSD